MINSLFISLWIAFSTVNSWAADLNSDIRCNHVTKGVWKEQSSIMPFSHMGQIVLKRLGYNEYEPAIFEFDDSKEFQVRGSFGNSMWISVRLANKETGYVLQDGEAGYKLNQHGAYQGEMKIIDPLFSSLLNRDKLTFIEAMYSPKVPTGRSFVSLYLNCF